MIKNILPSKSKGVITLLFCLPLLALLAFKVYEDDLIKKIATQLDKWANNYPQEKVYLQLDKPYYAVGDEIWFKAYVTIAAQHQLSGLSKVLSVDLIDDRDSVTRGIKLPLTAGTAAGNFTLPDTLKEGTYRIRAYTNWMRNFAPEYFFDKTIVIGNSVTNSVFTKTAYSYSTVNGKPAVNADITYTDINGTPYSTKEVSYQVEINDRNVSRGKGITDDKGVLHLSYVNNGPAGAKGSITSNIKLSDRSTVTKRVAINAASGAIDVQFFPEGGNLVQGLVSRVGFKAVGADGLGKDVTGVVFDNENNEVSRFSSQHLGMGTFMLLPDEGKTYHARVTFPDGSEHTFNIPPVLRSGYVLGVSYNDPENFTVKVTATADVTGDRPESEVELVAQSGGTIRYAARSRMKSQAFITKFPRSKFPSGIAQLTLFSSAGEPLLERLVFVNNPADQLKLAVAADKASYAPREKVKLNITAQSADGKPQVGSFSASVIDESKVSVDENTESSILSTILLTSDLKGYIEQPNYYFHDIAAKTQSDLDALMLTQGYRRFEWKKILADNFTPIVFQPEKSLSISGFVKSGKNPVMKGKVTLFTSAGGAFFLDTLTDDKGHFAFNNLVFRDSVRFVIQARNAKNRKDVDIDLENTARQPVMPNYNAGDALYNTANFTAYLLNSKARYQEETKYGIGNHIQQLKEVIIRAKKEPVLKTSSNLNGPGNANQIIKGDLFRTMGCPTVADCLQGRILGVIFRNGIPYSTRSMNTPMQIIVDGTYVDSDFLNDINPDDIGSIEVLRSIEYTSIYGSRGSGGVLVINTRRGGDEDYTPIRYAPGIITYAPKGYYLSKAFYSPQYDDPKTNTKMADLRSTIYWAPGIVTDSLGKASISFFNADAHATYRVVVEGIDNNGYLGHQVFRYKVQ